jgi:hypothetical protein
VKTGRGRDDERGGVLPDRDAILEWIRDNPDRASRRDIAKAFGIKATQKRELTELLRSLAEEGLTEKTRAAGGHRPRHFWPRFRRRAALSTFGMGREFRRGAGGPHPPAPLPEGSGARCRRARAGENLPQ